MSYFLYAVTLLFAISLLPLPGLYKNWKIAHAQGLPVILSPVATASPFWILLYRVCPVVLKIIPLLPFGAGRWAKYTYIGWTYDDKYQIHQELGPAFVICTPWVLELVLADAQATDHVLNDRKSFVKPILFYEPLNIFGVNIDTVEGLDWQRHRRITAPSFNEKVSSTVWQESIKQAEQMRETWLRVGRAGTKETISDTITLALHVLTSAGFGITYSFQDGSKQIPPGHTQSYRDVLFTVLHNFTILTIIPMKHLTKKWLPSSFQRIGHACEEFKQYMREMVEDEKANRSVNSNLLSSMVRVSEDAVQAEKGHGLSDEELYGNIFIYSMAGHETTANSLGTAIAYLAADPKWQDWIREEVNEVLGKKEIAEYNYEETWPRLVRCLAVMFETLRLHTSVPFIPKLSTSAQTIPIVGKDYHFPIDTFILVNVQALSTDPVVWGEDTLSFQPDRWISKDEKGIESIRHPEEGQYVVWAAGPRICPGRKFSQVEFVASLAQLLQGAKVEVKPREGETAETARKRLNGTIEDSNIHGITLQIARPQDVDVVWMKC